ncbi:hypothetical protein GCM10023346_31270 [Arthrobacter gyeryongensis]|uniref:Uncharacterized protein n=1 Tax=Arthrobacter gyeryongensis TaxID=1650592 RepID=A0ABP9SKT0_9MICC
MKDKGLMANLSNGDILKLEKLFGMSSGYVLDFTNQTFKQFVGNSLSFDPYSRYVGSKANILRGIWNKESSADVAKLDLELLEHWRLSNLLGGVEPTPSEQQIALELESQFQTGPTEESAADLAFLARDLGEWQISSLPVELSTQDVVRARLVEIDKCLKADAPLAVIFLVGSTLEGLLAELAKSHASEYTTSSAAPTLKGKVKPLESWTLAELIVVSRALGILREDVMSHADHVRKFRNYIHPRQQISEGFEPRLITAQIAQKVLLAALEDLAELANPRRLSRNTV